MGNEIIFKVAMAVPALGVLALIVWGVVAAIYMDMQRVSQAYEIESEAQPMYTEADMIQNKKNA